MMGYGWDDMMNWGSFGSWGIIMMIVFTILIVVLIVWLVRYLGPGLDAGSSRTTSRDKTPLEILKERYAKGEIKKEEFDEKKKDLV